jgi:type I restriction enzyme S subunit
MIELSPLANQFPKLALGDLCEINGGFPAPQNDSAFEGGDIPFVRMKDVGRYHFTNDLRETDQCLNKEHFDGGRFALTPRGSILMPRSGSVGLNHRAILSIDAVIVSHLCALVPKSDKIVTNYLYRFLCQVDMRKLTKKTTGLDSIAFSDLRRVAIPLPPISEQRRISTILDQADALRAKRREALVQLDKLTQSIFIEMFGDPTSNAEGWPLVQLSDTAEIISGYAFRSDEYVEGSAGNIKLCRGANVLPGRLDWSDLACWSSDKTSKLSPFWLTVGDIVIAMDRPWISEGFKIAQVLEDDCPSLLVQRVARIRGKAGVANTYLFHLLNHPTFTQHCRPTETTVPHISPNEIRSFRFCLPPGIVQQDFVKRIESLQRLKHAQSQSLTELDALFASLQHRAFRGEL